jgi:hypothetical protein
MRLFPQEAGGTGADKGEKKLQKMRAEKDRFRCAQD